jgi:hypothetical protein
VQKAAAFGAGLVRFGVEAKAGCLKHAIIDPSGDAAQRSYILVCDARVQPGLFKRAAV